MADRGEGGAADHGDVRRFFTGCRCLRCRAANADYRQDVARRKAYGTWNPFVDAGPVRDHVRRMMDTYGCGTYLISTLAGVSSSQVQHLLGMGQRDGTRTAAKIRTETAARLLSVRVSLDVLPPAQPVSPLGSRRRLHALIAVGWPRKHLATRYGLDDNRFFMLERRPSTLADTARWVRRMYLDLQGLVPEHNGVRLQTAVTARSLAADRGWPPPHCWDDDTIDFAETIPDWTGLCGTWQGAELHRKRGILPKCPPCVGAAREHRAELRAARNAVV